MILIKLKFHPYIQELQDIAPILNMEHIIAWLGEHKNYYRFSISESSCRKWSKWIENNEKPFPCVCSIREEDCVFIELYYELNKITKQEYSSTEFITSDLIELVLITQNEPYKKMKFLIQII